MTILRLLTIFHVLARHRVDEMVRLPYALNTLIKLYPPRYFSVNSQRGDRLASALEDLGPIFIKFGQALSTRPDLFPDDIIASLSRLQDAVEPFDGAVAKSIIEHALDAPIDAIFEHFDVVPLASASVAQVHKARYQGKDVVVKVIRPDAKNRIQQDVALLYRIARLASEMIQDAHRLHLTSVVREFEEHLRNELNLQREANNAEKIAQNFAESDDLIVPKTYVELAKSNVLIQQYVEGIPVGDIVALKARGVDFEKLAYRGQDIFFKQVFEHNLFHADMHPGNIFVDATQPEDPKYIAVDYGIVGQLTTEDQRYIAENFHAFFQSDYTRVAQLHVDSGWVAPQTDIDEFARSLEAVCAPLFNKSIAEFSYADVLTQLFEVAGRFEFEVQPQLVLLQKTLMNIEGLGRALYPELNLWDVAKPYFETWVKQQKGIEVLIESAKREFSGLIPTLAQAPEQLRQAHRDIHALRREQRDLLIAQRRSNQIQKSTQRLLGVVLFVLLLSGLF